MTRVIIISGFCFTVGNIVWPFFDEPKIFYVPLAVFISSLLWKVKDEIKEGKTHLLLQYFFILSLGNVIKQVFYNPDLAQINDYAFGAVVTIWLIHKLFLRWAIQTGRTSGRK